jgi:hypothetical protein
MWFNLLLKSDGLHHCYETHALSHFNQFSWTSLQYHFDKMGYNTIMWIINECPLWTSRIFKNQFTTIVILDEVDFFILPIVYFDLKLFENYENFWFIFQKISSSQLNVAINEMKDIKRWTPRLLKYFTLGHINMCELTQ